MRNTGQSVKCVTFAMALGLMPGVASQAVAKPLKIFLLVGHSITRTSKAIEQRLAARKAAVCGSCACQ
jgi:hypothetical protein